MYVTLNYAKLIHNRKVFFSLQPTPYFLNWYVANYRVIPSTSNQKIPRIPRRVLVRLL